MREFQSACARLQTGTAEEERQLEFEKALRQLDGNFLLIDRLEAWKVEAGLGVSFQNPSVEEFIEQRLGNDPGMLRVSVGAILSFGQIKNLLEYLETHAASMSRADVLEIYAALRECAYKVIAPQSDHFLNPPRAFSSSSATRWSLFDRSGLADRVQALLKLDKAVELTDDRGTAIRELMADQACWASLMEHVHFSHHAANSLRYLAQWIRHDSKWAEEEVWRCMEAMRAAFHQLMMKGDEDLVEINTIQELIDGFWTVAEDWPSEAERAALDVALSNIVDSLVQGSVSADDVASERHSLEVIKIILGSKYDLELTKLEQRELDLREQEEQQAAQAKEIPPVQAGRVAMEQSIDELFASLAER